MSVSLKQIGLIVQFGHWNGDRCSLTRRANPDFLVIHTNGIHELHVQFCGCSAKKVTMVDQLLAARMWPATTGQPATAATLEVLDAFNAHSGSGKDNAYDFYNALEYLTDAAGLLNLPVSTCHCRNRESKLRACRIVRSNSSSWRTSIATFSWLSAEVGDTTLVAVWRRRRGASLRSCVRPARIKGSTRTSSMSCARSHPSFQTRTSKLTHYISHDQ